jgi:hypothetical protein
VPVWVLLINWLVPRRAPRGVEIAGLVLSVIDVAAIVFRGDPANGPRANRVPQRTDVG